MNVYAIDPALLPSAENAQSLPANAPTQTFSAWLDEQIRATNNEVTAAMTRCGAWRSASR